MPGRELGRQRAGQCRAAGPYLAIVRVSIRWHPAAQLAGFVRGYGGHGAEPRAMQVLEIETDSINRGACVENYSQYPGPLDA